ncbi:MAG: hypothetical protein NVSMB57_03200 [Actinomycetota bacterium]
MLPALLILASMMPLHGAHADPSLVVVSLTPTNNSVTVPPSNISVQFNQCVVAPPSSYVELRSATGTLVSAFVSMPNCNTIQLGPTETLGSGDFTLYIYGVTVGGSATSMSTVFTVDGTIPAAPDPAITNPINDSNKTNVYVSGTGEPGASVFIVISDGTANPSVACGVSGQPSCGAVGAGGFFNIGPFDVTSLADSPAPQSGVISTLSIKAKVTLTDQAGNVSPAKYAYAFKDVLYPAAPAISYPATSTTNANQRWTISGTATADTGYRFIDERIYDNGIASTSTRAWCAGGQCAWHATLTMSGGAHNVVARSVDAAGNVGPASGAVSLTLSSDTGTGPVRPSLDVSPNPIRSSLGATGSAQAGAMVMIKIDSGAPQACSAIGSGGPPNYSCGPYDTTSLSQGIHVVTTTDPAANGGSSSVSIIKDLEAPSPPTVQFTDTGAWVNASQASQVLLNGNAEPLATVSGSITSAGGGTAITFSATADVFGNWIATSNATTLNDGALTACVKASDARGNASASTCTSSGPTLDQTPPPAPVIANPAEGATVTTTTFPVSGTAGGGAVKVEIFEGSALRASGPAASFTGSGLSMTLYNDGSKSIKARSIDQAGNVGPFSAPRTFTLAAKAPTLVSTVPANNGVTNRSGTITANYADPDDTMLGTCSLKIRDKSGTLAMGTTSISGLSCSFASSHNALSVSGNPYTATAQVTDPAGNSSQADTWTFTVDDHIPAAPVINTPAAGSALNTPQVQVSGTAEQGATVQVFEGATFLGAGSATPSWTVTTPALPDGSHTLTAVAITPAGNVGPGATRTFTIKTTIPPAPVINTPAAGSLVAPNTPVTGTAEAGTTVKLYEGLVFLGQSFANPSWTITPSPMLGDGSHTVTAYEIDAAGNQSPGTSRTYSVKFQAPAAPVISTPTEGQFINHTNVTVSGTAETGSTVRIFEGNTLRGTANASPGWSLVLSFPEGAHTIAADALDVVNNVSTRSQRSFTIKTTAPAPPSIIAPTDASTQPGTFTAQGLGERGSLVEVLEGVTVLGSATTGSNGVWQMMITLGDGPHTIRARQTDAAGNVSGLSQARSFLVDATAPNSPTLLTPAEGSINGAFVRISGTASKAYGTVILLENGLPIGSATVDAAKNWEKTVHFNDGVHSITAYQTDLAGNTGAQSAPRTFSADGTPPDVVITAPAPQITQLPPVTISTPNIAGGVDDTLQGQHFSSGVGHVDIKIYSILQPDTPVQSGQAACSPACGTSIGRVSWTYASAPLLPGIYSVVVSAFDRAGNVGTAKLTFVTLGSN